MRPSGTAYAKTPRHLLQIWLVHVANIALNNHSIRYSI